MPRLLVLLITLLLSGSIWAEEVNYPREMRSLIQDISEYSLLKNENFLIVMLGGLEIAYKEPDVDFEELRAYRKLFHAVHGFFESGIFYGHYRTNHPTPSRYTRMMVPLMKRMQKAEKPVFSIDFCSNSRRIDVSAKVNREHRFPSMQFPLEDFSAVPDAMPEKSASRADIGRVADIKSFYILLNADSFRSKKAYLEALQTCNADLIIIPSSYDRLFLSKEQITALKTKPNGAKRLLFAAVSAGAASKSELYWQKQWEDTPPSWMHGIDDVWGDEIPVEFWNPAWKKLIYGSDSALIDQIIAAGFDGICLHQLTNYDYFE